MSTRVTAAAWQLSVSPLPSSSSLAQAGSQGGGHAVLRSFKGLSHNVLFLGLVANVPLAKVSQGQSRVSAGADYQRTQLSLL